MRAVKIVIAPQAFKESLSALEAAKVIEKSIRTVFADAEVALVPVADGGDGTLQALVDATNGSIRTARVTDPIGEKVEAKWGALGDGETAVIEMAQAAGLALVLPEKRNPLSATTYGVGELIKEAVSKGYSRLIVAIGGSATNDAGAGMAQALGARLLDRLGKELPPGGAALSKLDKMDVTGMMPELAGCEVTVACDVTNTLTGPEGASAVYGPQKGATPEMVRQLDKALANFAAVVKRDAGVDISSMAGAGAAGGLGGGLVAFLKARLRPGAEIVMEAVKLDERMAGADMVITGEGRMDFQTVYNKAPIAVARLAKKRGIPVIALCGSLGDGYEKVHEHGITAAFAITQRPMTVAEAQQNADSLLSELTREVMQLFKARQS